jgi:nitric oxide reductase NorQ protein
VSTRLLIYAAQLIESGIPARRACTAAISLSLTDDLELRRALDEMVGSVFP